MPEPADGRDGGWAWMVLLGGFIVYFVNDGAQNSFSLVAAEIIRQMGTSRQSIGWIVSLKFACMFFVCPISAFLCHCFDVRFVGAVAALLGFLGYFAASFASAPWHLFVTIGLVSGPGVGTCFFITVVMVCLYFERLRATATGIALCGSGLGGLAICPLVSLLLHLYGWQGTLLLLSGLYLNTLPCCLLFRPIAPADVPRTPSSECTAAGLGANPLCRTVPRLASSESPAEGDTPPQVLAAGAAPVADAHNKKSDGPAAKLEDEEATRRRRLLAAAWLADYLLLLPGVPWPRPAPPLDSASNTETPPARVEPSACRLLLSRWRCVFDNRRLLAFQATRVLLAASAPTLYAYSADRGFSLGLSAAQATGLMSIMSACNMVGRLAFGCFGDRGFVPPLALYGLALAAGGGLVVGSLTARAFAPLAAFMGPACCLVGGAVSLTTLVTVRLDGTHRLFNVFARQSIFQGVGVLIGPPVAGAMCDVTGGYSATFALIGAALAASGLAVLAIHWSLPAEA